MSSILNEARFQNEEAAFAYVEAHVWPNGRVCPHCGVWTTAAHSEALPIA